MTDPRPMLNHWLSRCYEADVLRAEGADVAIGVLRSQCEANQQLADAARTRLSEITEDVTQRCFVSKKHRDYLTQALGTPPGRN